jgi:glycosyltransferase involved in cell wall biosynthesis
LVGFENEKVYLFLMQMIGIRKIVVILPAYNAAQTLRQTYTEIPLDIVDEIILTDDASTDDTVRVAEALGIKHILKHDANKGYGANQKTCYTKALNLQADVVIMLHPDYQYTPKLIPSMAHLIANEVYSVVLGSRILGKGALKGGMPVYKYVANRALTFFQNLMTGAKLSEYHTGYRAFSGEVLRRIDFMNNSDGFVFDNEMLSQIIYAGFDIAEISCPAKYFKEASSINFANSVQYGLGVVRVSLQHFFQRTGLIKLSRYKS